MTICQNCRREIPDDAYLCPYCGLRRSYLRTNYSLGGRISGEIYRTSGTLSTYLATGSATVATAEKHPDSVFLDIGAKDFKETWPRIPVEFVQRIREGEDALKSYNEEIERRERAARIVNLIGMTNVMFQHRKAQDCLEKTT